MNSPSLTVDDLRVIVAAAIENSDHFPRFLVRLRDQLDDRAAKHAVWLDQSDERAARTPFTLEWLARKEIQVIPVDQDGSELTR